MRLLIETGLTHFKYAQLEADRPLALESLFGGSGAAEPPWASALARLAPTPHAVYVANGGPATFRPRLTEWIRRAWHIEPQFIGVPSTERPALPVARYLALVGARQRQLTPALVLTADATIAVDRLDNRGQRIAAWTFPGERPMRESLYAQTSGIAAAALLDPPAVDNGFGVNTAGAVQEGARLAIASCVAELAQRTRLPVVATGRFANDAVQWIEPDALILEDLAMEGLASVVASGHIQ